MSEPVTFVNVVDVDPAKQQEVIDLLVEGTEKVMSKRPGFISVTLLASLDKSRVINVARWESAEDVKTTQSRGSGVRQAHRCSRAGRARALYGRGRVHRLNLTIRAGSPGRAPGLPAYIPRVGPSRCGGLR